MTFLSNWYFRQNWHFCQNWYFCQNLYLCQIITFDIFINRFWYNYQHLIFISIIDISINCLLEYQLVVPVNCNFALAISNKTIGFEASIRHSFKVPLPWPDDFRWDHLFYAAIDEQVETGSLYIVTRQVYTHRVLLLFNLTTWRFYVESNLQKFAARHNFFIENWKCVLKVSPVPVTAGNWHCLMTRRKNKACHMYTAQYHM